jgi:hypothetical protein
LTDAVRGVTKALSSDNTNAESTDSTGLTAFGADGFTVGADTNYSDTTGSGMVAWSWLGDGVDGGTLNEVGSLDSQVNANTTSGFSICTYDGNETSGATFGHGLSEAPTLVIVKKVVDSGSHWLTGFNSGTAYEGFKRPLTLNRNNAQVGYDDAGYFYSTSPSATVVYLGNYGDTNKGTGMVAYCFHSVEGFSKIGSYYGNGNVNGSFAYTGFRPAWILLKPATATGGWGMMDNKRAPHNVVNAAVEANVTTAEFDSANYYLDFLSNGFKIRTSDGQQNTSGNSYLYMAFAEFPFKYSNAR